MTIGAYFAKAIAENNYKSEIINGKTYKAVEIRDKDGNLIGSTGLFDTIKLPSGEEVSELVGKRETTTSGSFFGLGKTGVDAYGKLGFTDAQIESVYGSNTLSQTIGNDGNLVSVDLRDANGNNLLQIRQSDSTHSITYDSNGALTNGVVESHYFGDVSLKLTGGDIDNYYYYQPVDKFDSILSGDLKDGYGFQITRNADGTYNLNRSFGQTFTEIFKNGFGAINPFTPDGAKNAMTLFMPQNLIGKITQAEAQNIANTIQSRYNYFKDPSFGYTDNEARAWAVYDTAGDLIGFTPLLEGIYGVDITTGKLLTGGERALKIGEGLLSTVGNAVGGAQLLHEIGFVPKIGSALSSATAALRTFNAELGEAGNVLIDPALSYAARNDASVKISGDIAESFYNGIFETKTAGEIRATAGISGNFELPRVFTSTDVVTLPDGTVIPASKFEGAWLTTEKYTTSQGIATNFLELPANNLADKTGLVELDDSVRLIYGRTANNKGFQFYITGNTKQLITDGKIKFLVDTIKDVPK